MSRAVIVVNGNYDRDRATQWAKSAPSGCIIEFRQSRRSLDQNARLWACLTEIARKVEWHGMKLPADDWKDIFTAALRKHRFVPGLDENTVVPLGMRTSDMTKQEFSDLLELINAFAAERGIEFNDHQSSDTSTDEGSEDANTSSVGDPAADSSASQGDEGGAGQSEAGDGPAASSVSPDLSDDQRKKLFLLEECAERMVDAATHQVAAERTDRLDKARMAWLAELPDDKTFVQKAYETCSALIDNPAGRDKALPSLKGQARKWMGVVA